MGRLRAVTRGLKYDYELFQALTHLEGRHATMDDLLLCHTSEYIQRVKALAEGGGGRIDADTVVGESSWEAAMAAVGCVLDAVDLAFSGDYRRSFCAVRPPGHHAVADSAMGFCLFGNVAIGARYAKEKYNARRVLVVDWDVHHGNGTQALLESDPDIHFVSMHQWPWYPGTGASNDRGPHSNVWNVALEAGLPPESYVSAFKVAVNASLVKFEPDIIFISAGFDSMEGDPLGNFTLTESDFSELTRFMRDKADLHCEGRLISVLEGGYNTELLTRSSTAHMRALALGTED